LTLPDNLPQPSAQPVAPTVAPTVARFAIGATGCADDRLVYTLRNVEASCHKHFVARLPRTTNDAAIAVSDECYQLATVQRSCNT